MSISKAKRAAEFAAAREGDLFAEERVSRPAAAKDFDNDELDEQADTYRHHKGTDLEAAEHNACLVRCMRCRNWWRLHRDRFPLKNPKSWTCAECNSPAAKARRDAEARFQELKERVENGPFNLADMLAYHQELARRTKARK
jgi:hypothetical protein